MLTIGVKIMQNREITTDNQEHVILLVTITAMLENNEPKKKIIRLIDEFLYPHLKDNNKTWHTVKK